MFILQFLPVVLATLCFLLVTKGKLPLYYGSSVSYIAAIVGITSAQFGQVASDTLISQAQFGIICSGFISILAGLVVGRFGMDTIEKILPATVCWVNCYGNWFDTGFKGYDRCQLLHHDRGNY